MNVYRKGISGKLAEYAVKKYKGHRRIPDHVIEELIHKFQGSIYKIYKKYINIIITCLEFY